MKKFIKNLALILVIAVSGITFLGCSNSKTKTAAPSASQIAETGSNEEIAENVTKDESTNENQTENEQPKDEKQTLAGAYVLTSPLSFDNADRSNADEVIEFFKTRDFNGVHNAITKLGFDDYIKMFSYMPVYDSNNNYEYDLNKLVALYFDETKINEAYYGENKLTLGALNIAYSIEDGKIIIEDTDYLSIVISDENTLTVRAQFFYQEPGKQHIFTPLWFETSFKKVAHSENLAIGTCYTYKNESLKLSTDKENTLDFSAHLAEISEMFKIDSTDEAVIVSELIAIVSEHNEKYYVSDDYSKLIIQDGNTYRIFTANSDLTYTINGITISIASVNIDVATGKNTITANIALNDIVMIQFDLIAE